MCLGFPRHWEQAISARWRVFCPRCILPAVDIRMKLNWVINKLALAELGPDDVKLRVSPDEWRELRRIFCGSRKVTDPHSRDEHVQKLEYRGFEVSPG
jgi:hypothetical protein